MQMNVSITEELHGIVQEKVNSGLYSNASEVIRDAIRQMNKAEEKEEAWQKLNQLLEAAGQSGRSSNKIDAIVKSSLKK